jgi:hypothetical protein
MKKIISNNSGVSIADGKKIDVDTIKTLSRPDTTNNLQDDPSNCCKSKFNSENLVKILSENSGQMDDPKNPKNARRPAIYNKWDGNTNDQTGNYTNQKNNIDCLLHTARRVVCVSKSKKSDKSIINTGRISDEQGEAFFGYDTINIAETRCIFCENFFEIFKQLESSENIEIKVSGHSINILKEKYHTWKCGDKYWRRCVFSFGINSGVRFGLKYYENSNSGFLDIQYQSTALMGCDFFALHKKQLALLGLVGVYFDEYEKIARIDFHVTTDISIKSFVDLIDKGHAITALSKKQSFDLGVLPSKSQPETRLFGIVGNVQIEIYDKRKDLSAKRKDKNKYRRTIKMIGDDWFYSDKPMTRIEFRFFGKRLRKQKIKINTIIDFQAKEQQLIYDATHKLFRLIAKPNNPEMHLIFRDILRKNKNKIVNPKDWDNHGQDVIDSFNKEMSAWKGDKVIHPIWERITNLSNMIPQQRVIPQEQEQQ